MADDSGEVVDNEESMMDEDGEGIATGYGGDNFANSERGVYSSPYVQSFSNTGAPGSQPLPTAGTQNRNVSRAYNQAIGGGAFTPLPSTNQLQILGYPQPGSSKEAYRAQERSLMLPQTMQPKEEAKKEKAPGGGGMSKAAGSSAPAPDWMTGKGSPDYSVERNPFPFQPVVPVAGSGVKRTFFEAQNDLLKTLLPYWNK